MLNSSNQLERLSEIAGGVCLAHRVALVDARFVTQRGVVLKVLIEPTSTRKGAGVTLTDCQAVSRDLSTALDVEEALMPAGGYRLEVGSAGLERPLLSLEDFERFAGREVKVRTKEPIDGRRQFTGELLAVQGETIWLKVGGKDQRIVYADIAKAKLVYRG